MKKIFYILIITVASTMALTSCTEETVKPVKNNLGTGTSQDPITR